MYVDRMALPYIYMYAVRWTQRQRQPATSSRQQQHVLDIHGTFMHTCTHVKRTTMLLHSGPPLTVWMTMDREAEEEKRRMRSVVRSAGLCSSYDSLRLAGWLTNWLVTTGWPLLEWIGYILVTNHLNGTLKKPSEFLHVHYLRQH